MIRWIAGGRPGLWVAIVGLLVWGQPVASGAVGLERDVEPILVRRCSECHGPDKQKGGLRLDRKAEAMRGGKSGRAGFVAGQPEASELIRRVTSQDADDAMPPKGERLGTGEVEVLVNWVREGAVWPEREGKRHWSFVGPVRPGLPEVRNPGWVRNEIDRFILARLEQVGLGPSPEADRYTLYRRLCLDLTGLPPAWGEAEAFARDDAPAAYERAVDGLLASPHYGEQQARWWLDLARYADSNGYQVDLARSVWPYRDWVIRAMNENLRFDRFTIEQLAGDLLPSATLEQRIATGFHRNTKINDEGGGDAEEYRTKAVKDRVATTATTWLGLTLMCAECHSHKYDPLSQEDYYRFYAFFNNTADGGNYSVEPTVAVPPPDVGRSLADLRGRIAQVQAALAEAERSLPAAQAAWEVRERSRDGGWVALVLTNVTSTGGSGYTNLADGSVLATGANPIYDTILAEAGTDLALITAVQLEALPDPSLPKGGPGRWGQTGNFILDEMGMTVAPAADGGVKATNAAFAGAVADWEQEYYRADHAVDGNPKTGWAISPRFGERHFLIAALKEPVGFPGGTRLGFRFDHYHGNSHTLGRFRLWVTGERDRVKRWPVPQEIRGLLATPAEARTAEQRRRLTVYYRGLSEEIRRLERELFRLNQREAALAGARYTSLVLQELPQPRVTHVQLRGNFLEPGNVVSAGVPGVLPPLATDEPANRLALARWLVSAENPLTSRVTVNRLWERLFGTGLVRTSDDFGRQGELPSHPELLDWLATEFVASGWNLKAMMKRMVMSAAYRQSAVCTPQLLERDFYNRLLARGPRFRLDAEAIRDQALAVSGLLVAEVGGPSVYPVQVPNLWKEIGFLRPEIGMDEWPLSEGPDRYRRGIYTFWRRVCTYPLYATFDAPSREVCTARRPRTNTPLQALAALNDPTLVEAARVFAQRVLREGGAGAAERVDFAFRTCLGRSPSGAERERLLSYIEQQRRAFAGDTRAAERLVAAGSAAPGAGLGVAELAAWMMVANVLFNLDETLTRG
jgi:hypothetical protein